jgi:hypothetical protein
MIKHIVLWKLKPSAEGSSAEPNARAVKARLETLRGRIPGLRHLEVGIDCNRSEAAYDVALYSEFETRADLDAYQAHPDHQAVAAFIARVRAERVVVDYETP